MIVGVNGVGKTTSIGKLAARYMRAGKRTLLVAGDTFRAAAIEQLTVWAERTGADLVRHQHGGDPGAVAYDGVRAALARGTDVVIVDTAGRLHTKSNLMEELHKVRRVIARELHGAPHETLLVVDAVTGQNGLAQARAFLEHLGDYGDRPDEARWDGPGRHRPGNSGRVEHSDSLCGCRRGCRGLAGVRPARICIGLACTTRTQRIALTFGAHRPYTPTRPRL